MSTNHTSYEQFLHVGVVEAADFFEDGFPSSLSYVLICEAGKGLSFRIFRSLRSEALFDRATGTNWADSSRFSPSLLNPCRF